MESKLTQMKKLVKQTLQPQQADGVDVTLKTGVFTGSSATATKYTFISYQNCISISVNIKLEYKVIFFSILS